MSNAQTWICQMHKHECVPGFFYCFFFFGEMHKNPKCTNMNMSDAQTRMCSMHKHVFEFVRRVWVCQMHTCLCVSDVTPDKYNHVASDKLCAAGLCTWLTQTHMSDSHTRMCTCEMRKHARLCICQMRKHACVPYERHVSMDTASHIYRLTYEWRYSTCATHEHMRHAQTHVPRANTCATHKHMYNAQTHMRSISTTCLYG